MTFVAGTPLSAADLNDALASDSPTTFSTTTPAGTGWYRFLLGGALVEFHWNSTGTVAAGGDAAPDFTIPSGYRPAERTPIAPTSGSSAPRVAAADVRTDGTWRVYNDYSVASIINVHGTYKPA